MRLLAPALLAGLCAAAAAQPPGTVYRCEDARGKIAYSDTPCPPSAKSARKVDNAPTLKVDAGAPAAEAAPGTGRIEPSRPNAGFDPLQEDEKISAQIAEQKIACDRMTRRLRYLEQDLAAASPANRSSAELALRRAQDEVLAQCPRR